MKKLFIALYFCVGIVVLFQASKLIGTITERNILGNTEVVRVQKEAPEKLSYDDTLHYDASISLSPLFHVKTLSQRGGQNEPAVADSSLLRRYELNGVIVLPKNRSIALIRKSGDSKSKIYKIGDTLDDMEVVKIERDKVHLSLRGRIIILPMYYKYTSQEARIRESAPVREEISDEYEGSRKVQKVLSRSDVENRVFNRVNEILTQIAISPYLVDGKMEGLRLIRVPKGNIVYELGGRSGDLVKRVNGHELNQIDQMYQLWENIKDDSQITVDIERNKQIYSFDFEIRE
jgi:type II secretion system protein C